MDIRSLKDSIIIIIIIVLKFKTASHEGKRHRG